MSASFAIYIARGLYLGVIATSCRYRRPSRYDDDLVIHAGVTELRRRLPGKKVAATGFCFGGGMTWLLLASKERRLAAAVPFYGAAPPAADVPKIKAAILVQHGELDKGLVAAWPAYETALKLDPNFKQAAASLAKLKP